MPVKELIGVCVGTVCLITFTALGCYAQRPCVIAIDIGHSKSRPGATSARGKPEFDYNREVANLLLAKLQRGRLRPFLINDGEVELSQDARTAIATKRNADFLVSIHHDSVQPKYLSYWRHNGKTFAFSDHFRGYSLFYSKKNPRQSDSLVLAKLVGAKLRSAGFTPTYHHAEKIKGEARTLADKLNGVYEFDDLLILKTAKMPAILIECGVIVNRDEDKDLLDPKYQRRIVDAIADGLVNACERTG